MKPIQQAFVHFSCALLLFVGTLNAQDIAGSWEGKLKIQGVELRLVFHLNQTDGVYEGTMDSPDQNAYGIPLSEVLVENDSVHLKIKSAAIYYKGKFKGDGIDGLFTQGNFSTPMPLVEAQKEVQKPNRPQEPKEPYNYLVEEVTFHNSSSGINLAGTLTRPKDSGPFPAVVLISGSGAQNRDEEIYGHKPFKLIAHELTSKGIAVLRFDDRGTAASEGNHAVATSADFATDVSAAVDFLKSDSSINPQKIGLIGHSEGGIIAPMVHAMRDDIAFMVLLAGTGVRGDRLLLEQQRLIGAANGMTEQQLQDSEKINKVLFDIVVSSEGSQQELSEKLRTYLKKSLVGNSQFENASETEQENYISGIVHRLVAPWMRYFLKYDPSDALQKTTCAVLALNGSLDLQVPAAMNLSSINAALKKAGNTSFEIQELEGLNHLFQECETGAPGEYNTIEQTMAPIVLSTMSSWILKEVN